MKKIFFGLLGVAALSIAAFAQQGTMQSTTMKSNYLEYSKEAFDKASSAKRVLFFAASWCPSCRSADKNFNENLKKIPENVMIFKTDYDKETALKTKYKITRQHSFVYVDAKGVALKSWAGGGIDELLAAVK
ncbi:MAG: thioredoxin family protein [Deinococcales bacterium]